MQYESLGLLKCPLAKTELRFQLISEIKKKYSKDEVTEIYEGILFSETGFVFPIIEGIPRLLLEAIYDYSGFLRLHLNNYDAIKNKLEANFPGLLNYCLKKNSRTKKSFELEWSFLNKEKKDRVWHYDSTNLISVFLNEVEEEKNYFENKTVIDIGSGHGLMTSQIASISRLCVGIELSKAVEDAYLKNTCRNALYIQGDLQFLPFSNNNFDVLYSSGVIHHTNNTELSLSLIETVLKKEGKICLWLYHPQKKSGHKLFLLIRKIISKLPLRLAFVLIMIFIFPLTFLIKRFKRKNIPNYREEIIDLLDGFTPEFRFEVPHDVAFFWLQRRNYSDIKLTTSNQFGLSISAKKK
jgi:ubiquinone/menaquinone biosynthesis C-methylase UbiE/uncharacterized protein YbaR (Trm112 family)